VIPFKKFFIETANIAGGGSSVFGTVNSGAEGNQFPSQNDSAYAPGDARVPALLGSSKKKKKKKPIIQRRRK
jgi:hypothetical protein